MPWTLPLLSGLLALCIALAAPTPAKAEAAANAASETTLLVDIPDANLRAVLNTHLAVQFSTTRAATATVTVAELQHLTGLAAARQNIRDLTGLEHATNLVKLVLDNVPVTSVAPLANLTRLRTLHLAGAQLADISPLAGLTHLRILNLHNNQIQDISPLTALTGLDYLRLDNNQIQDIRALSPLQSLRFLNLRNNQISDIATLVDRASLQRLDLRGNPLNYAATAHSETLRHRMHLQAPATATDVPIVDPLLRARINKQLGSERAPDAVITAEEMLSLTTLNAAGTAGKRITDIRGLSYAQNLTRLDLGANNITDVTPLAGVTKLEHLYFYNNSKLADIMPLARLSELRYLDLWRTRVSDLATLANFKKLRRLQARGTGISDISVVQHLPAYHIFALGYNQIRDLAPLVANPGVGSWDAVHILGNPLSYEAIYTQIPALQARGTVVTYTNRVPETLTRHTGNVQSGIIGESLATPLSVLVKDANEQPFEGVPVTWTVTRQQGSVSHAMSKTNADGIATTEFTLGSTPGANEVTATVVHAGVSLLSTRFFAVGRTRSFAPQPPPPAQPVAPPQREAADEGEGDGSDGSDGNTRSISHANLQAQQAEADDDDAGEDTLLKEAYYNAHNNWNTWEGHLNEANNDLRTLNEELRDIYTKLGFSQDEVKDNAIEAITIDPFTIAASGVKTASEWQTIWGLTQQLAEKSDDVLKVLGVIDKAAEDRDFWWQKYSDAYDDIVKRWPTRAERENNFPNFMEGKSGKVNKLASPLRSDGNLHYYPCPGGGCSPVVKYTWKTHGTHTEAWAAAKNAHFVVCEIPPHKVPNETLSAQVNTQGVSALVNQIGHYSCVASQCTQAIEHHLICRGDLGKPGDGQGCDDYFPPKMVITPTFGGPSDIGDTNDPLITYEADDEAHRCNQLAERDDDTDHEVEGPFVSCKSEGDDHYNCQGQRTCINDNKHAVNHTCDHPAPKYATQGSGRHAMVSNGQCPYRHPTRGWECQRIGYYRCENRHGKNPRYGHQYAGTGSPSQDPPPGGGGDGGGGDDDGNEEGSPPGRGPEPIPTEQPTGNPPTENPPADNPPTGNQPTGNLPTEDPGPAAPPATTINGDCGHTYLSTSANLHARRTGRCPTTVTYNGQSVQCTRRGYYRCAYKHGNGSTGGHQFATARVTFVCGRHTGQYRYRANHELQASCSTSITQNGRTVYCTVTNYYDCLHDSDDHVFPAPPQPVLVDCGNPWWGDSACDKDSSVSTATAHSVECDAGHTYWSCNSNARAAHETLHDCTRPGCNQQYTNCSKGDGTCSGGSYTWHDNTQHTDTGGGGGGEEDPPPRTYKCSRCKVRLSVDVTHAVSHSSCGNTYYSCNPGGVSWHETTYDCKRPGCGSNFTNCTWDTGTDRSCTSNGRRYRWHSK